MATGQKFPDPPIRSPLFEQNPTSPASAYNSGPGGKDNQTPAPQQLSFAWVQHLQNITNQFNAGIPITGSRSNGDALHQLLTALDKLGFIKNTSTA